MAFTLSGDAATNRTNLGLGTAATLNTGTGSGDVPLNSDLGTAAALDVGTGANNIIQLDGSGNLPAVDGSSLTGISAGATEILGFYEVTSAAASHNILTNTDLSAYHRVTIQCIGMKANTSGADFYVGVFNASDSFHTSYINQDGIINTTFTSTNSLGFRMNGGGMYPNTPSYSGTWDVFGMRSGTYTACYGHCVYLNSSGLWGYYTGAGTTNDTWAVRGFKMSTQSGSITAGKIWIIGHKDS